MNPIDLTIFAEHSQKLPAKFLAPDQNKKVFETRNLFYAHFLDFSAALMITTMISLIFNESIKSIITINGLNSMSFENPLGVMLLSSFPLILFSYFFFSYFMNHGQTIGMFLLNNRVQMNSKSFKETLRWSSHSLCFCFSFGLSYLFVKSKWQNFRVHDYLYHEFVAHKENAPVHLITIIDDIHSQSEVEIDWAKAA